MQEEPLDLYARIQGLVKKEIQDEFKRLYEDEYATKYGVADVPLHRHNGADSPFLGPESLTPYVSLSAVNGKPTTSGVLSSGVLGDQTAQTSVQASNPQQRGTRSSPTIYVAPIPIIFGFGTVTIVATTLTRPVGATSATLTVSWGGSSSTLTTKFSTGEQRDVNYTNGSAAITWSPGLDFATSSTTLTVIANSQFKGGEAPVGTTILFVNPDDGLRQLWVRADIDNEPIDRWYGFDFSVTAP